MFLQRLEIHGFKSFAQKTVLEFLPPRQGKKSLTAVVGPNGSGKSNIADGIRWVLGEQSLKTLRGKKSEDVIFAGSDKKARLGLAEVSLILNNESGEAPLEMSEVTISRRLYRDGESEYLINGHAVRLADVSLLLARARFGQKTYTVIGQGMADAILAVSATERKEYFDEAAGVNELQIKRQQAGSKLKATGENLKQAEALLQEIEPRLRSLNRQVKRLTERGEVEQELRGLQKQYYGHLWYDLAGRVAEFNRQYHRLDEEWQRKKNEQAQILNNLNLLEKESTVSQVFLDWQKKYQEILLKKNKEEGKKLKLQHVLELAQWQTAPPHPQTRFSAAEITRRLEFLKADYEDWLAVLINFKDLKDLPLLQEKARVLQKKIADLILSFKESGPEKKLAGQEQTAIELAKTEKELSALSQSLQELTQRMQNLDKEEKKKKERFFELQRAWQAKQEEGHVPEQKLNNIKIELAKLETRQETLAEEINLELGPAGAEIKLKPPAEPLTMNLIDLQPRLFKLKHQLELIGGIDPEVAAEHKETKERYDFLSQQTNDLNKALADTLAAISELDEIMKERRGESLKKINEGFGKFFRLLFDGGQAKLAPLYEEENKDEEGEEGEEEALTEKKTKSLFVSKEPALAGIEIQATPPGKRIKDINFLSGGERALTSIALLCAILSHHPSPFVVLDEVDAALDESNSLRFAEILDHLSGKTQFIIVTHNRATMTKADVLYGVTMGDDGISRLLSVKLEEAEKMVE